MRPVIVTDVELLDQTQKVELTLANRDENGIPHAAGTSFPPPFPCGWRQVLLQRKTQKDEVMKVIDRSLSSNKNRK